MKKRILATTCLIISMTLSACGQNTNTSDYKNEIKELQKEIENLNDKAAALENENMALKEQIDGAINEYESRGSEPEEAIPTYTVETSGVCGVDAYWEYGNGVLVIKGSGDMTDFSHYYGPESKYNVSPAPWTEIKNKIEHVYIMDGITSIGSYAFQEMNVLCKISIPDSVERISSMDDFIEAKQLTNVKLPENLKIFGMGSLYGPLHTEDGEWTSTRTFTVNLFSKDKNKKWEYKGQIYDASAAEDLVCSLEMNDVEYQTKTLDKGNSDHTTEAPVAPPSVEEIAPAVEAAIPVSE